METVSRIQIGLGMTAGALFILYFLHQYSILIYTLTSLFLTSYEYYTNFRKYQYGIIFYFYCLFAHVCSLINPNIIHIITITLTSDTLQYFSGKFVGKTRNIISISPNKSLEGYLVGGGCCWLLFTLLGFERVLFIVVSGIMGDLLVSYVKRQIQLKDSGSLLKSHGGWLDRIDSVMLAAILTMM